MPVGGGLSAIVLGLLVLARVVPVDPRKGSGEVGGGLKLMRGVLDRAYDVATYLRIDDGHGAADARCRATLEEVLRPANGYAGVAVAAHSQGSVYTVATLFGDPHRRHPEGAHAGGVPSWRERGRDTSWIAERPVLVTFGSPLAQLYRARLPDQSEWVRARPRPGGRHTDEPLWWANVFRARDFVGRSLFVDPLVDAGLPDEGCWAGAASAGGEAPRLTDACLRGAGHHVGFWGDRELALWLDAGIRCLASEGRPRRPPGTYGPLPTRPRGKVAGAGLRPDGVAGPSPLRDRAAQALGEGLGMSRDQLGGRRGAIRRRRTGRTAAELSRL